MAHREAVRGVHTIRLTRHEPADLKWSSLSRGELAPFGERGSAVLSGDIAAIEVAVLVEDPMGTDGSRSALQSGIATPPFGGNHVID
jgi:hypothetical protein